MKLQKTNNIHLSDNGNIIYRGLDLELSSDQLFDLRTQLGYTSLQILEFQYKSIIEKKRSQNLQILLD
jgi:hypothetical protein